MLLAREKGEDVTTVQNARGRNEIVATRMTVQTADQKVGVDVPKGMVVRYKIGEGELQKYNGGEISLVESTGRKSIFSFRKKKEIAPKTVSFVFVRENIMYDVQWCAKDIYRDSRGEEKEVYIQGAILFSLDLGDSACIYDELLACPSGYKNKSDLDLFVDRKKADIRNFLVTVTTSWIRTLPPSSDISSRMTYLQRNIVEKSRGLASILAPYAAQLCDIKFAPPQCEKVKVGDQQK